MDAKTYPLQDILKPERRYVIPTFQRDYEWTQEGQWRLLFEDLESTADRLLEVRNAGVEGQALKASEQNISPHFLGAIVCAAIPFSTGGVAPRSVIDGQQRLTTVQLLVRGLADALTAAGSDRTKSVRRMLFNPDDVVETPDEVYKLWPRRKDRELWPTAIGDEVPDYGSDDHLYLQARKFFADQANTYATVEDENLDTDRLVALADAVSSLFKLVVIDLDDNDDAQVIFEVLNGRQTPLSAIDLVKNLVFLRSELDDDDVDALYDKYWQHFDEDWWKVEVGRGHAQRGRRDVLLSVWLTAATGAEASVGHLYRDVRHYLDEGPATEEVLAELNAFARAYRAIYEPPSDEDPLVVDGYSRIQGLEITTAIPLLAWLRTLPTSVLAPEAHVRAVRAIESWAVRRVAVGLQTRGYGTYLTRVLREAKAAASAGKDVVEAIIVALQDGVLDWPTDTDVEEAFCTRRFYGVINQGRIKLLLASIDQQQRTDDPNEPDAAIDYGPLQIEHVMPGAWPKHWPLLDDEGNVIEQDDTNPLWVSRSAERDRVVNRLGNLTLVTGDFNREVSNLGWDVKRPEFQKQKSLVINYAIADEDTWDEAAIAARAQALAKVACIVWPGPTALCGSESSEE